MISGSNISAGDALGPVSHKVEPPWLGPVCLACPSMQRMNSFRVKKKYNPELFVWLPWRDFCFFNIQYEEGESGVVSEPPQDASVW